MTTPDGRKIRLTVVVGRFVGDDTLLVRVTHGDEGRSTYQSFVRQGDLVSEIWFDPGASESFARSVTRKAATRLCAATPAC